MFSLPLLYTMEVWWAGFMLHPGRILIYGVATFILLLLYNRFAGLRRDATMVEVVIDSVEELGLGLVLSALVLWLAGRIGWEMDRLEVLGKIVMEAMTVAIGISVGTAQLGTGEDCGSDLDDEDEKDEAASFPQLSLALCGAVLFASNVAPTDEISVIASESHPGKLLLIALLSILLGSLILHFSGFRGSGRYVARDTAMRTASGICSTYAVALIASAGLLWFFGRLDGEPFTQCLAQTIVLGLPAVLGASAGRLMLQSGDQQTSEKS